MSRSPVRVDSVDLKSLPLSPVEGFVFSVIDGVSDEQKIAMLTGLAVPDVASAILRLVELGAVRLESSAAPPPSQRAGAAAPSTRLAGGTAGAPDLDPARAQKIDDLFAKLDDVDHYELLGVPRDAEKKRIKSAYYATAPEFHPDKFFRKDIGPYKAKIEAIFVRFTAAYDALTSKEKRPEYDAYLVQLDRTRAAKQAMAAAEREAAEARAAVEAAARAAASAPPVLSAAELAARRDTLARTLLGRVPPKPAPTPAAPPVEASSGTAADALKLRYEYAKSEALRQQIGRHTGAARDALARRDYVAAANSFRIATTLAPSDTALAAEAAETAKLAARELADGYWKQAEYEAQSKRWSEAALSYQKVCDGRPDDARSHERVAFALIHAGGAVRRAVEFARRAVELSPNTPDMHVTLAFAYKLAGLEKSSETQVERALELAPNDARVKHLVQVVHDHVVQPHAPNHGDGELKVEEEKPAKKG